MAVVLQFRRPPPAAQSAPPVPSDAVTIAEAAEMFRTRRGLAAVLTVYGWLHRDGRLVTADGKEHQL